MSKAKTNNKTRPYKGDPDLEGTFADFGANWSNLTDEDTKKWVGELLVLAHKLDEENERTKAEWWMFEGHEKTIVELQEMLVGARRHVVRYRSQLGNSRNLIKRLRREVDLKAAQLSDLQSRLGAAWAQYQADEAEKAERTATALAQLEATDAA